MPSFSHHTDRRDSPPAPTEPNGGPLSERIAFGSPTSLKIRSSARRTPTPVGSTTRAAMRYRVTVSSTLSGSQRVPSRVRNHPLKSIDHSPFGSLAPATISPCGHGRRRRGLAAIRPSRFRMSPIVEAAGQSTAGGAGGERFGRGFFGPQPG